MQKKSRLIWMDVLKGLAIVLVVAGHVLDGYINADIWPERNSILKAAYEFIYGFHMPLCFTISGYLYRKAYWRSQGSDTKKIVSHAVDFIVLYVIFCVLMWAFKIAMSGSVNNKISKTSILFIWAKPMPTYWYFYVLVVFYLLFIIPAIRKISLNKLLVGTAALSILSSVLPNMAWFQISRITFYSLFFTLGMWMSEAEKGRISSGIMYASMAVGILANFVLASSGYQINKLPVVSVIIPFMICYGIMGVFSRNSDSIRGGVLQICGLHMQEIYVMHCFVAPAIRMCMIKFHITNIGICLSLSIIISLVMPILFGELLRKANIYDVIFRSYSRK